MSRVLVVDDDADFVEAVRICLERAGHTVVSAFNPEDGMREATQGAFDLLILDIMMNEPDDGLAMAQRLRRTGFTRPILMMSNVARVTGFSYEKDRDIMPVDEFLEKPVPPEVLLKTVDALLSAGKGGAADVKRK